MSDRRMAGGEPGLAERPERETRGAREVQEVLEVREEAEEVSGPRAEFPGVNGDPALRRQLEIVRSFQEYWALYRIYCEVASDGGNALLPVEFQCVVDRDTNAV